MKYVFLLLFLFLLSSINSTTKTKETPKNLKAQNNLTPYKFRTELLRKMNEVRRKHHAKPLSWDSKLAQNAKAVIDKIGELEDPMTIEMEITGEIIFIMYQDNYIDLDNVVWSWEKEEDFYNYNYPWYEELSAMFTQLVWKESTKVGCAFSSEKTNDENLRDYLNIVVCKFDPKGNIEYMNYDKDKKSFMKLYADNVLPEEIIKAEIKDIKKSLKTKEEVREKQINYVDYIKKIY